MSQLFTKKTLLITDGKVSINLIYSNFVRGYLCVMRPSPHPRNDEGNKACTLYRGGKLGLMCAEAFLSVLRSITKQIWVRL